MPVESVAEGRERMFRKKVVPVCYDRERMAPAIRCSICTGEQAAGFRDRISGRFEEVMVIRSPRDLDEFCKTYGVSEPIEKIY